jgi:hypothetical protein
VGEAYLRHAGGDQLRACQSTDHHALGAGSVRGDISPSRAAAALRRIAQHLQVEEHAVDGKMRLFVHRKGATRAFGPGTKPYQGL